MYKMSYAKNRNNYHAKEASIEWPLSSSRTVYNNTSLLFCILNRFLFTDQRSLLMHALHIFQQVVA